MWFSLILGVTASMQSSDIIGRASLHIPPMTTCRASLDAFLRSTTDTAVVVITPDISISDINTLLADSRSEKFLFTRGVYRVTAAENPIIITRSRILVEFEEGVVIANSDDLNIPLIVIGDHWVHDFGDVRFIHDVVLRGQDGARWTVDGVLSPRSQEKAPDFYPWNRVFANNNNIDARGVDGLMVSDVASVRSRSGGLVTARCKNVFVLNSLFEAARYDGIAPYNTENLFISNSKLNRNIHSGLSLDGGCKRVVVDTTELNYNGHEGLFARASEHIFIGNSQACQNGLYGFFFGTNEDKMLPYGLSNTGRSISHAVIKDSLAFHNGKFGVFNGADQRFFDPVSNKAAGESSHEPLHPSLRVENVEFGENREGNIRRS